VIEAQEIERRRLAGDIHDGISQRLVTLSYRLDAATRAVDDPEMMAEQLSKARELVDLTLQEGPRGNQWAAARRCSTTSGCPAG
jgi:signal transduction histidine kinase